MFGVLIDGATNILYDNGSVCVNTTRPKLTLPKKNHSIAYYLEQEAVTTGTVKFSREHTSTNLDDIFTKTMVALKREGLLDNFTH